MQEDERVYLETRALAAELLRTQRIGDRAGFLSALSRCEGKVTQVLTALTGIANRAMDTALTVDQAERLVDRLASELPTPPSSEELHDDAWLDAVALLEAVYRDDREAAAALFRHTPDMALAFGQFVQLIDLMLKMLPPDFVEGFAQIAREEGPPIP
jgi:hypothetical protein